MKNLNYIILGLTLILNINLEAQEKSFFEKNSIKIYINGFHGERHDFEVYNTLNTYVNRNSKYFDYNILSFALDKKINKRINRELEFMPIRVKVREYEDIETNLNTSDSELIQGDKTNYFESSFRYQINIFLFESNRRFINPFIGLSTRFKYESFKRIPKTGTSFITKDKLIGLSLNISPGFEFKLNESLKLDLNVPINFYEIDFINSKIDNPALHIDDQNKYLMENEFFPRWINFRIGLKFNINRHIPPTKK